MSEHIIPMGDIIALMLVLAFPFVSLALISEIGDAIRNRGVSPKETTVSGTTLTCAYCGSTMTHLGKCKNCGA